MKAFLEPYYGGSHKNFAQALIKKFPGEFVLFTLPDRYWKWRMHGAAVSFTRQMFDSGIKFSEIFATSLIDLSLLKALVSSKIADCRYTIYFHENQLAYPWSKEDKEPENKKDMHYGFINFTSALAADRVIFNSEYNRTSFFENLIPFLKSFPDENLHKIVPEIEKKSEVIYPGIDFVPEFNRFSNDVPVILWNHRWEYDKNPELFFNALFEIKRKGVPFKLVVAGQERVRCPEIFNIAKEELWNEIISWGYIDDKNEYIKILKKCDIIPVTSYHEFFGISVLEAVSAGVIPLLPERLSYPELFPHQEFKEVFYKDMSFVESLENLIENINFYDRAKYIERAKYFNWNKCVEKLNIYAV